MITYKDIQKGVYKIISIFGFETWSGKIKEYEY